MSALVDPSLMLLGEKVKDLWKDQSALFGEALPKWVDWHTQTSNRCNSLLNEAFSSLKDNLTTQHEHRVQLSGKGKWYHQFLNRAAFFLCFAGLTSLYALCSFVLHSASALFLFSVRAVHAAACFLFQFILCLFFPCILPFFMTLARSHSDFT